MTTADYIALLLFAVLWIGFSWVSGGARIFKRISLNQAMAKRRQQWIHNSLTRDLKMIDTQIMAGLQNGTAFFASTTIFALGGCFALLGATEQVDAVIKDLPVLMHGGRAAFELKVGGLSALFGYSFFKFGWSYRLFNYCTILFGCIPMTADIAENREEATRTAERVLHMNIEAARHFNAGLRAIFLAIGYLGWFINAYVFMLTTVFIIAVLAHRQFFSRARSIIIDEIQP
ncbi:DUF599 family protein [Rhizobiaceae bacterium n13]|uniref:DUF599 family protein n=1 Tax=Ferirhizobium litorale TaxID=2927786 RepID=A0AAE3QG97_9HYPH|nr:DUF599 family protein [Fererhizobium litorale]MDI7864036.1 DUF599 family protein [Fererhizobium litorale]MDI7924481.1 DUF599 family protein [Fererhizobium litorale]